MGTSNLQDNLIEEFNQHALFYRRSYYMAFRQLIKVCGEYSGKVKMLQNATDGVPDVLAVVDKHFQGQPDKIIAKIRSLECQRKAAVENLQYWSCQAGFKPMSTPEDVKRCHLDRRADTTILLDYLTWPELRTKLYYCIDKYAEKGELKSIIELLDEAKRLVLKPKRKSKQSSLLRGLFLEIEMRLGS